MPIIYAVVARGPRVLCEYALSSGNFATIARKILEKLPEQREDRHSYEYDEHVFHVLVDGDLVFMCMCDHDFGRVLPFHFLNEVRKRWLNHGSEQLTVSFGSPGGNVRARATTHCAHGTRRRRTRARMTRAPSPRARAHRRASRTCCEIR